MQKEKSSIVAVHLLNDFSGSPLVFMQALQALQASGHRIAIYTSGTRAGFLDQVEAERHRFPYRFFSNVLLRLTAFCFSQIFLFFQLLKYRRKDVVIYVNTLLPFGAALAGRLMGKKVIYHVHESYTRPLVLKKFLRGVAAATADTVFYVSDYLLREEKLEGVKARVVYNALPEEFVRKANTSEYLPSNAGLFQVLMVCSLKEYKGVPQFVSLAARHPALAFELVLNATGDEIAAYFKETELPANLKVFPVQKNLDPFYRRASLVVNLTNPGRCIETFGMTLLEAMCYGVPVIAPPLGGPAELVEEQKNGFAIDVRDEATLDFRLNYLAANPDFMERLSDGARQTAQRFGSGRFSESVVRTIEGIQD
ncbi:MAG: glycosyltransferase family 4 protein [Bacteroidia bacterium]|nr:glycosyltransferase family 4 protein [Bacteroidia bacterium]